MRFSVGINYWPRRSAMAMWHRFDAGEIREDFARIAGLGLDAVRFFLRWADFQPGPGPLDPLMLERLGVLGGRVLAAHATQLSDADLSVLARHGVSVAHCPGSNAKLAAGTARLVDLLAAGVPTALGTDGPASNDDLDLWEEMRLAALFARLSTSDAAALTAAQALLLATRGGADALRRDDIGALEAGRWADVVHVDVDDPAFATGLDVPDGQLLANLVWAAGSRAVRDVWVAGDQVVANGEPTRVDRAAAQAAVREVAARLRG